MISEQQKGKNDIRYFFFNVMITFNSFGVCQATKTRHTALVVDWVH